MKSRRRILSGILKSNEFTGFEKKVYRIVALVPRGSVCSYKWVADKAGRPRSCRAVGNALNKNRYPSVIPCHRIIKSDGSIGGYAGGAELKKKLLRSEGVEFVSGRCRNLKRR